MSEPSGSEAIIPLRGHRHSRARGVKLELTPLIDVIFILLIFFAVSTTFVVQHKGIKLQLPDAVTVVQEKKGVTVSIDERGQLFLDKVAVDIASLEGQVSELVKQTPTLQIILHAHEDSRYERVISVMDAVRLGGCFDIVLEAKKKSRDAG